MLPAVRAPGETKHDWQIATEFGRALATAMGRTRLGMQLFPYAKPEEIFNEHRESTRGRDLDITGLSYAMLEAQGPQQWPLPEGAHEGKARLYTDGRFPTPSGRARFVATEMKGARGRRLRGLPARAEHRQAARPVARHEPHGTRAAQLFNHVSEAEVALHPRDLQAAGMTDGTLVKISSRRGSAVMRARASEELRQGGAFIPMHWGGQFVSGAGVNALTSPAFDPYSKQPELKHAAVQVVSYVPVWRAIWLGLCADADAASALSSTIAPLLKEVDFASNTLAGRDTPLVRLELAHTTRPDAALIDKLDTLFGLEAAGELMRYSDARRGVDKRARFAGEQLVAVRVRERTAVGRLGAGGDAVRRARFRTAAGPVRAALAAPGRTRAARQDRLHLPRRGRRPDPRGLRERRVTRAGAGDAQMRNLVRILRARTQADRSEAAGRRPRPRP